MTYSSNIDFGQILVTGIIGIVGFVLVKFMRMVNQHLEQINDDHKKLRYVAEVVDHHSYVILKTAGAANETFRRVSSPSSESGDYDEVIRSHQ